MVTRFVALIVVLSYLAIGLASSKGQTEPLDRSAMLHWGTREGLPHSVVKTLVQTPDGCLWLGTQEGLARFDGDHFTTFTTRNVPGLVSNNIYDLKLDCNGTLWIHANMALSCYRHGVFTDMSAALPPSERIFKIWIGRDGKCYMVGSNLYRADGDHLSSIGGFASLITTEARVGCQASPDGTVWLGTDHGNLYNFKNGKTLKYATAKQLGMGNVNLDCDRHGTVWLVCAKGFFRLSSGRLQPIPSPRPLTGFAHAGGYDVGSPAIVCDRDGNVWACDGSNLFHYQHSAFVSLNPAGGAPAICTRIGTDADGHFFALGLPPAKPAPPKNMVLLYRYDTGRFLHLTIADGMLPLWAFPADLDREHNLWVGTLQGLELHHAVTARTFTAQDGLPAAGAGTLCAGKDGSMWIGTQADGLWRVAKGHFYAVAAPELNHAHVSSLMQDRNQALWVGIADQDVYRVQDKRLSDIRKFCQPLAKGNPIIYSVAWGPKGAWAAATSAGLLHLVRGRYVFTDISKNPVLRSGQCRLFIDRESRVWALGGMGFTPSGCNAPELAPIPVFRLAGASGLSNTPVACCGEIYLF